MASTPPVRTLDPANYHWKQYGELPRAVWRRPPLANEAMWLARPKECRDLFVYAVLRFHTPADPRELEAAVKSAWKRLRFEIPELVLTIGTSTEGKPYLQYETPRSEKDVDAWIARTSYIRSNDKSQHFPSMCDTINERKQGRTDNAFVFAKCWLDNSGLDMKITVYFDHLITDGIGARIMLGRYLSHLAFELTNTSPQPKLNWQENHDRLSPPWISLLNCSQQLSGKQYNEGVSRNRSILTNRMKNNHGIRLLGAEGLVKLKMCFVDFDRGQGDDLNALLQQIKLNATQPDKFKNKEKCADSESDVEDDDHPRLKITQLGHAAMILAMLRFNPLPLSSARRQPIPLYSPCWFNGRNYLLPTQGLPDPSKNYIPLCLSFAPIKFPDLRELSLPSKAKSEEIKSSLVKACWIAAKQYAKIGERKNMLTTCVELFEDLGKQKREQDEKSKSTESERCMVVPKSESEPTRFTSTYAQVSMQGTPPKSNIKQGTLLMADRQQDTYLEIEGGIFGFSGMRISATTGIPEIPEIPEIPKIPDIPVETVEPFFLSDGIIERYIDHEYFESSASQDKTPIVLFEVRGVKFAATADRNLIVRMSSWRKKTTLQAEWRSGDYDDDTILRFLTEIKKIMLSILK